MKFLKIATLRNEEMVAPMVKSTFLGLGYQ